MKISAMPLSLCQAIEKPQQYSLGHGVHATNAATGYVWRHRAATTETGASSCTQPSSGVRRPFECRDSLRQSDGDPI